MSEHTALTTKEDPIYQMLGKYRGAIASVLPKHMKVEKMLRVAYQMIYRTPKLKQCTPASLINGIIEISMLGLDIGRTAHLVPFKSEAVVIPDYKGLIELAHRSGQINSFPFKAVYENDLFDYEEGTSRFIKHKPAAENRGKLIAAYAIANFKHGGFDFEVVLPADIEATKKMSAGAQYSDSPWRNPDTEWTMWCKTAVRRLSKRLPQSPELQRATELEDLVEAGLGQRLAHVVEQTMETPEDQPETPTTDPKEAVTQKLNELEKEGQTQEIFQCPYCDFNTPSERGLKKHKTQQHADKLTSDSEEQTQEEHFIACPNSKHKSPLAYCENICPEDIREKCTEYNDYIEKVATEPA